MKTVLEKNEMFVKIDWLEFTIDSTYHKALKLLGFELSEFKIQPRGARGYRSMIKHKKIDLTIMYDGADNMGTHITIPSSAFDSVFYRFMESRSSECPFGIVYDTPFDMSHLNYFLDTVLNVSQNVSRFDIAIDDLTGKYFTVDDVYNLVELGQCVSKFRTYRYINDKSISNGVSKGKTIYFGSRQSDIMLRVYDKSLEQKVNYSWIRWEFELKNERAMQIMQAIINYDLAIVVFGTLTNYLRFIDLNRSERSKCKDLEIWTKFIDSSKPIKLFVKREERTLEDVFNWFDVQVGPSFAKLLNDDGGAFIFENIKKWNYKGGIGESFYD